MTRNVPAPKERFQMLQSFSLTRRTATLAACLLLTTAALGQTPATPDTPTGRWVAEHPSNGGIGSWWDFRSNGTLTQYFGAIVTSHVSRSGDTLIMPSGQEGAPPVHAKIRIADNILYINANNSEVSFTRVGPAPSASDPLLGKWKPIAPKVSTTTPQAAAIEKAEANALYVFSADGTESVRIPFGSRKGTWDAKNHTFQFKGQPTVYSYQFSGTKLILGQPPDNKKTDTYLPDPIFD
jgi:hypothetical protein